MTESQIFHYDDYKVFNALASNPQNIGSVGFVRAFENDIEFFRGYNLVVASGREFTAQKVFETTQTDTGSMEVLSNHKVSHFAMGAGGVSAVDGMSVELNGPTITDTGLNSPITLGDSIFLDEPSFSEPPGQDPVILSYKNAVKPIETDDGSIIMQPVLYGNSVYRYTQVKCTCVLTNDEPTALLEGQSVPISEAGLYFVNGTDVRLFAHICFPPKYKEKGSSIKLYWYILF